MNLCLQYVAALGVICRPFMPFTSDKIRLLLNQKPIVEKGELVKMLDDLSENIGPLKKNHKINEPVHLFTRIDDEVINAQIEKLQATAKVEEVQSENVQKEHYNKYNHNDNNGYHKKKKESFFSELFDF